MNIVTKIVFLALLAGGIVLIIFGISAMDSFSSDVSKFFNGSPSNKAIWMLVVGIILAIVGGGGSLFGWSSRK